MLVKPAARRKLRNRRTHDLGAAHKGVPGTPRCKDAHQFHAHALTCNRIEQGRALGKRLSRGGLDGEVETAGKAHRTQHAQGILLKPATRLSHRTDHTAL